MTTRRTILGTTAAALGSLAGCGALPLGDTSGNRPEYANWIGPRTYETYQASVEGSDVSRLALVSVRSPNRALENDHLSTEMQEFVTTPVRPIRTRGTVTFDVDPGAVDTYVSDVNHSFRVARGSFGADELRASLPDGASARNEYGGHEVFTYRWDNGSGEADDYFGGFAVDRGSFVYVGRQPDPETAVANLEGILDTGAGDATRAADGEGPFATVVDELGDGVYLDLSGIGTDFPSGVAIELDGDTAHRRSIRFFESERKAERHWLTDDDEIARLRTINTNNSARGATELFVPYESVDVTQTGRRIVVTGTLPTAELTNVDTTTPARSR